VWKLTRGRGTSHSSNASAERSAEKEEGWLVGINRRPAHPPGRPNRGRWCASEDGERRVLIRSRPGPTAKIADRYMAPDPLAQKSEGNEGHLILIRTGLRDGPIPC
jgi:hypothetical protein